MLSSCNWALIPLHDLYTATFTHTYILSYAPCSSRIADMMVLAHRADEKKVTRGTSVRSRGRGKKGHYLQKKSSSNLYVAVLYIFDFWSSSTKDFGTTYGDWLFWPQKRFKSLPEILASLACSHYSTRRVRWPFYLTDSGNRNAQNYSYVRGHSFRSHFRISLQVKMGKMFFFLWVQCSIVNRCRSNTYA